MAAAPITNAIRRRILDERLLMPPPLQVGRPYPMAGRGQNPRDRYVTFTAALVLTALPAALVAVTLQLIDLLWSAVFATYVAAVAPAIGAPLRSHWYL